eukprot:CAMPEP_0117439602 /NCGR_PEP_ID=MMETSP0759-20121206/2649_1 /TAXON_ID=63605 /ORGANISM="Percolomonas cosmopolitus, Strain WS" /LENGTH=157 /DNA_ID=CAMNT_0005231321 /DNA_START=9 /DNA_END=482 /DNA_ORIENTATION=-
MSTENKTTHKRQLNEEKLAQLRKNAKLLKKSGGRGVRRKHVVVKKSGDESSKAQQVMRKLNASLIPDIDEVNFFMDNHTIMHFTKPKVHAAVQSNAFVISGRSEQKSFQELLPQILEQLQPADFGNLQQMRNVLESGDVEKEGNEDLPEVESFDQVS